MLYPGTHKWVFVEHVYPNWDKEGGINKGYFGIKNMPPEDAEKVYPAMDPGDVVFFHPHVIHGSGENKTKDRFRKSISCHYAASDCKYIDIKGTFHEVDTHIKKNLIHLKSAEMLVFKIWIISIITS